jgi:hypothetical protein
MDELYFLEESIELLALRQYGIIDFTCAGCTLENQEDGNCALGNRTIKDIKESVWYCKVNNKEYFSCPLSLIHPIVYELYDKYSFIKEFNNPQTEHEMSNLFWWFVKKYNNAKNMIENYKHEEMLKKHK